ncbi:MAG: hypothetical protein LUE27_07705 [Clostridia bacterium]|nr:hypothetical protein [Clostridia bacterium]
MEFRTFEELKKGRQDAYKGMVAGGIEGFLDQHTGFYPDPAHFLYELLQNAEDMNATKVTFRLESQRLIFEHNGTKRNFELRDIDSITNKGKSQKADDVTQIGKFGMGFKAVYDYTNTPEIHSGQYHFRIEHFIVPNDSNMPKPFWIQKDEDRHTQFIFPFNNSKKPAAKAVTEIRAGFEHFNETALLFLSSIKEINYSVPDGGKGKVSISRKVNGTDFLTCVTVRSPEKNVKEKQSYWATFSADCPLKVREEGSTAQALKKFPVSIAYHLNSDKGKYSLDHTLAGKVCIFFPTEIDSGLRFHINAPFASTIARDVILYSGEDGENNDLMIQKLAELTASSVHKLKAKHMLDYAAYMTLPQDKDFESKQGSRYKIFADLVRKEMLTDKLFVTENGDYKSVDEVLMGTVGMKRVLPSGYPEKFFKKSWIPTFQPATRIETFIKQFDIQEYSIDDFVDDLAGAPDFFDSLFAAHKNKDYAKNLCFQLSQAETRRNYSKYSYEKIMRYLNKPSRDETLASVRFILCDDGQYHSPGDHIFFRTSYTPVMFETNPVYVDLGLRDNVTDRTVREFLLSLGVKEMCAAEDFTTGESGDILSAKETENIVISAMILIDNYTNGRVSGEEYADKQRFAAYDRDSEDGTYHAACANECCWSKEAAFFSQDKKYIIAKDLYAKELGAAYMDILKEIFSLLGGKTGPVIEKLDWLTEDNFPLYDRLNLYNARSTRTSITYTLSGFDWHTFTRIAEEGLYEEARMLWEMVVKSNDKDCLQTIFQPNTKAKIQTFDSTLVYYLKRIPWVPATSGEYKRPCDLLEGDLSEDFEDIPSVLRAAISETPYDAVEDLRNKGVTDDKMLAFAAFDPDIQQQILQMAQQMQEKKSKKAKTLTEVAASSDRDQAGAGYDDLLDYADSVSVSKPKDLSQRRAKLEQAFDSADPPAGPAKKIKVEMKSASTSAEERSFMYGQYHSKCQICSSMGFLKADGTQYFEAINIFSTKALDYTYQLNLDLGWNTLSLCPLCAAKLKYSQRKISTIIDDVLSQDPSTQAELAVDITLENKPAKITFTPKHFLALQVAIQKIQELEAQQAEDAAAEDAAAENAAEDEEDT